MFVPVLSRMGTRGRGGDQLSLTENKISTACKTIDETRRCAYPFVSPFDSVQPKNRSFEMDGVYGGPETEPTPSTACSLSHPKVTELGCCECRNHQAAEMGNGTRQCTPAAAWGLVSLRSGSSKVQNILQGTTNGGPHSRQE